MALSNLTSLDADVYQSQAIKPFDEEPYREIDTSADPAVTIALSGWLDDGTMAFVITTQINTIAVVNINTKAEYEIAVVLDTGVTNPSTQVTYWNVGMGAGNGKDDSWHLEFQVERQGSTSTGKWRFSKIRPTMMPK